MGGIVRRIRKVVNEGAKAAGLTPSKADMAAEQRAAEQRAAEQKKAEEARMAQMQTDVVDAREPDAPDDVIYAGEQSSDAPKKKKKRRSGTILTSTKGVMGDAPTEQKTLLGG